MDMETSWAYEKYIKAVQCLHDVEAEVTALEVKKVAIQVQVERWNVVIHKALLAQARAESNPNLPLIELMVAGAQIEKILLAYRPGDYLDLLDVPLRMLTRSLRPALDVLLQNVPKPTIE